MQTPRLIHKKFTMDDLDALVGMRSDPGVVKYLGGAKSMTRDWNKSRLKFYISCYPQGIGLHKMYWKQNLQLIGWSGLQPLEGGPEIEVSYGMIREFWGMGIGTEAARGWLKYGFEVACIEKIVAVADGDNTASRKIMEKLGMSFESKQEHYGMDCVVYGISRKAWLDQD